MDAIECGIVKLPRVPVADNLPDRRHADLPQPLGAHRQGACRRRGAARAASSTRSSLPSELQTALDALYGHYEKTFDAVAAGRASACRRSSSWSATTPRPRSWSTTGSPASSARTRTASEPRCVHGHLELFRNYDEYGNRLPRPRTLLIDSEQLESGEALDPDFREDRRRRDRAVQARAGAARRRRGGREDHRPGPAARGHEHGRQDGRLGEQIRCVVSVSMLTEGWDANTVTHILGVRAFGTQLLCEQVVGRGAAPAVLRAERGRPVRRRVCRHPRHSLRLHRQARGREAEPPERDRARPCREGARGARDPLPARRGLPGRAAERAHHGARSTEDSRLELTPELVGPCEVLLEGIVGEGVDADLEHLDDMRPSTISFHLAKHLLYQKFRDPGEEPKLHLFGQLKRIARRWLDEGYLSCKGGTYPGPAPLPGDRRQGGRAHLPRLPARPAGREADQGDPRPLQPRGLDDATSSFTTSKKTRWQTAPEQLPRQLGGLRQRLGGRVRARRRGASARAGLRQEPGPRARGALSRRRDPAQVPARLHRQDRRRPAPSRST